MATFFGSMGVSGGRDGPDVTIVEEGKQIILDNGIIFMTILKPSGLVSSLSFGGIDNIFDKTQRETGRGYLDLNWGPGADSSIFDVVHGTKYEVISKDLSRVEIEFVRFYDPKASPPMCPLNIRKRFVLFRGCFGFYFYAIYERPKGWPAFSISQTRFTMKLNRDKFHYMAISDDRQREMPGPEDFGPGKSKTLGPQESTLFINPSNPKFKGEVDDKYHYSSENKDLRVHGWICENPAVGFWVINPSDEYRNGGITKQNLTAHVGPTLLSMFHSSHYGGDPLCPKWAEGEDWKKVFGPTLFYVNKTSSANHRAMLWSDAKSQMFAEISAWPYSFPSSSDYLGANQRSRLTGRLLVSDLYIQKEPWGAAYAYVGLALPGEKGSWQIESKGYQHWTQTDAHGNFDIQKVNRGTYNLFGWVPGILGDFKWDKCHIVMKGGEAQSIGDVVFKPTRDGPTLWEIGVPDRSSNTFFIPEPDPKLVNRLYLGKPAHRFRQYGLWARYSQMFPDHDLVYTVGKSDWRRDWWWCHINRKKTDGSCVPATWQIKFQLDSVQPKGQYKLRLAIASSTNAAIQVRINDPKKERPHFDTMQFGKDNSLFRCGCHGLHHEFTYTCPGAYLQKGENSIYLTQRKAPNMIPNVMYDYIRLEEPPTL